MITCRAPRGARGLKPRGMKGIIRRRRRAPRGARGLKLRPNRTLRQLARSRPAWGAWIETRRVGYYGDPPHKSRPAWGAWIETPFV